jgi:uncharacterized membrane protein HdeD (DUF308 family)
VTAKAASLPPSARRVRPGGQTNLRLPPTGIEDGRLRNEADKDNARRRLRRLYLFRVGFSAIWVAIVFSLSSSVTSHSSSSVPIGIVLGTYPAVDGLATLVDLRLPPGSSLQGLLWLNLVAGVIGAVSIVWPAGDLDAEVRAFGTWAIASGGVQLVLGVTRQWSLKGQWLMILSGGGSIVAGTTFLTLHGSSSVGLLALAQYSLGGAVWYLLTAALLTISAHISLSAIKGE